MNVVLTKPSLADPARRRPGVSRTGRPEGAPTVRPVVVTRREMCACSLPVDAWPCLDDHGETVPRAIDTSGPEPIADSARCIGADEDDRPALEAPVGPPRRAASKPLLPGRGFDQS
jgi:hypothetical protein